MHWRTLFLLVAFCFGAAAQAAGTTVAVRSARIWPAQDYTRVAFEAARAFRFELSTVKDPERLVLDLENVEPSAALSEFANKISADDPYLKQIRVGRFKPGTLRIVFDLKGEVTANAFALEPVAGYGHRLVLDIYPAKPADPLLALIERGEAKTVPGEADALAAAVDSTPVSGAPAAAPVVAPSAGLQVPGPVAPPPTAAEPSTNGAVAAGARSARTAAALAALAGAEPPTATATGNPAPPAAAPAATVVRSGPASAAPTSAASTAAPPPVTPANPTAAPAAVDADQPVVDRLTTIAIDAGHGGEDPGAHGRNALEKDVTLAIARRLKQKIDAVPNMRAVLVRDGDYFIPLAGRTEKARRLHADVFVSVHADSFISPTARGSSVFALSERGASSAAASWLAKRENEADLIGGVNLAEKDPYLARTLLDLSQTATIHDSLKLGRAVLNELSGLNSLHRGDVEQAGFAVLKSPDIPSILVETAFISNPAEEKRLSDAGYQDRMASAIVSGLKRYLARNPLTGRARTAKGT